jgi:hypothetical protein
MPASNALSPDSKTHHDFIEYDRSETDSRWVNPCAILANVRDKYSGRALRSIPMKKIYDLTVAESIVVQGMVTMTSTRAECVRSSRDTTCVKAEIQSRSWAV